MEENKDPKINKKIDVSQEGFLKIINKIFENKEEERELSLDRYRRADEQMQTPEQFVLLGKNAVSFLKLASDSTNGLMEIAKEIKSIVHKTDAPLDVSVSLSDEMKKHIIDEVSKMDDLDKSDEPKTDNPDDLTEEEGS